MPVAAVPPLKSSPPNPAPQPNLKLNLIDAVANMMKETKVHFDRIRQPSHQQQQQSQQQLKQSGYQVRQPDEQLEGELQRNPNLKLEHLHRIKQEKVQPTEPDQEPSASSINAPSTTKAKPIATERDPRLRRNPIASSENLSDRISPSPPPDARSNKRDIGLLHSTFKDSEPLSLEFYLPKCRGAMHAVPAIMPSASSREELTELGFSYDAVIGKWRHGNVDAVTQTQAMDSLVSFLQKTLASFPGLRFAVMMTTAEEVRCFGAALASAQLLDKFCVRGSFLGWMSMAEAVDMAEATFDLPDLYKTEFGMELRAGMRSFAMHKLISKMRPELLMPDGLADDDPRLIPKLPPSSAQSPPREKIQNDPVGEAEKEDSMLQWVQRAKDLGEINVLNEEIDKVYFLMAYPELKPLAVAGIRIFHDRKTSVDYDVLDQTMTLLVSFDDCLDGLWAILEPHITEIAAARDRAGIHRGILEAVEKERPGFLETEKSKSVQALAAEILENFAGERMAVSVQEASSEPPTDSGCQGSLPRSPKEAPLPLVISGKPSEE